MKSTRKRLQVIRGGLPELRSLTDEQLSAEWRKVQERELALGTEAKRREQSLREAADAFDQVVDELNELSHTLRHYQREFRRRAEEA